MGKSKSKKIFAFPSKYYTSVFNCKAWMPINPLLYTSNQFTTSLK